MTESAVLNLIWKKERSWLRKGDVVHDDIPKDFDPEAYLELNPDVASAGVDPLVHYLEFGKHENRYYKHIAGKPSELDESLHSNPSTQRPQFIHHENIWNWIGENFDKPGIRVLEIGSRAVVSDSLWTKVLSKTDYIGFDILPGKNVDVVGDAHFLSEHFEPESFDLVISFAVMEHIALPWVFAEEISKVLRIGGTSVHETHFSYSEHELPWHFFNSIQEHLRSSLAKNWVSKLLTLVCHHPWWGGFQTSRQLISEES